MKKPIPPDPTATAAEHRRYAEANAEYSRWIAEHPSEQAPADAASPGAAGVAASSAAAGPPQPHKPKFDPDTGLPIQ